MLKQVLESVAKLLRFQSRLDGHDTKIAQLETKMELLTASQNKLRDENALLRATIIQVVEELRHSKEIAAKDLENLMLRLELALQKSGRTLLPSDEPESAESPNEHGEQSSGDAAD